MKHKNNLKSLGPTCRVYYGIQCTAKQYVKLSPKGKLKNAGTEIRSVLNEKITWLQSSTNVYALPLPIVFPFCSDHAESILKKSVLHNKIFEKHLEQVFPVLFKTSYGQSDWIMIMKIFLFVWLVRFYLQKYLYLLKILIEEVPKIQSRCDDFGDSASNIIIIPHRKSRIFPLAPWCFLLCFTFCLQGYEWS